MAALLVGTHSRVEIQSAGTHDTVRIVRAAITADHLIATDLMPSHDGHEFAAGAQ